MVQDEHAKVKGRNGNEMKERVTSESDEEEVQVYARVPLSLFDAMNRLSVRHYRSFKGEMCAALEAFVYTPAEYLRRDWRWERGSDPTGDSITSNWIPVSLVTRFKAAASRCHSQNEAILRAFELWVLRYESADLAAAATVVTI